MTLMIFEQRSKGSVGMSYMVHWRRNIVRNRNQQKQMFALFRNVKEAPWLEAENEVLGAIGKTLAFTMRELGSF